ncbi:hypothetical protein GCM10017772_22950 [Promicromonospora soli]|uniref:Uncharacterized protein n=1 Tax=Promicromonospora soli TaxID=2035533 RepID=A0A919KV51_9MICO|nr:hypothetical protein GCM10017772_22950 [Promicromonospora soli]
MIAVIGRHVPNSTVYRKYLPNRMRYRDNGYAASTETTTVIAPEPADSTNAFHSGSHVSSGVMIAAKFAVVAASGSPNESVAFASKDAKTTHAIGSTKHTAIRSSTRFAATRVTLAPGAAIGPTAGRRPAVG